MQRRTERLHAPPPIVPGLLKGFVWNPRTQPWVFRRFATVPLPYFFNYAVQPFPQMPEDANQRSDTRNPCLSYYEVSNGEVTVQFAPTLCVDITATESRKRSACYAHASQAHGKFYAPQ